MPFPKIDINPLVAVIVYDNKGQNIYEVESIRDEYEREEVYKYFIQPIEFYQWVRRYFEITIFRGRYRATYITFIDITLLFVSRVENISAEIRPKILEYIKNLGSSILFGWQNNTNYDLLNIACKTLMERTPPRIDNEIDKIFTRLGIEKPELIAPMERTIHKEQVETKVETYEEIKPFETVPKIDTKEMTQEILNEANKRAITSLLFSSIRSCDSPAASAYIFPKEGGSMGELYAGNLEERKIVYVLETLTKYPRVIYEMIKSENEIKALNAEVVQIIVEDCTDGKLLVGMTTDVNDVINVGYKFKIVKHILHTMGF